MRRLFLSATLACALLGGSVAQAALITDPAAVGEVIYLRQTDNGGIFLPAQLGGGPFRADASPNYDPPQGGGPIGSLADWITFCLELNEALEFNDPLTIAQITGSAFGGGLGGGSPDPISLQTKFVYNMYRMAIGPPNGPGLPVPDPAYANGPLVQRVIWILEDEDPNLVPGSAEDLLIQQINSDIAAGVPMMNDVVVLNLVQADGRPHQDVLALVDPIPEPASLVLVGSGLLAAGLRLRKRRRS